MNGPTHPRDMISGVCGHASRYSRVANKTGAELDAAAIGASAEEFTSAGETRAVWSKARVWR